MSLPNGVLEEGLAAANGQLIYGNSFHELSQQELIAVAALGWKYYADFLHHRLVKIECEIASVKREIEIDERP